MRAAIISALILVLVSSAYASTLDGYDRAKLADENYALANGGAAMTEAANDPKLSAVMKKYIYADIVRQAKISQTERKLVEVVVLTTNQNHKFLARVAGEALALGVKPIEIREALYHVAPYIGYRYDKYVQSYTNLYCGILAICLPASSNPILPILLATFVWCSSLQALIPQ